MENSSENLNYLSIRINSDGFSLSVSEESGLLISTKTVSAQLFSLRAEEIVSILKPETELNCGKINIICETDHYIFVPTPFFKPEEAPHFVALQNKLAKNERVLYNVIPMWDTVNIFTIPAALLQALVQLFPEQSIEHHMSSFLNTVKQSRQDESIHVWARAKMVDIILLKAGKLQLINSYSYQTPEDFTYHTLNVAEQLAIDTEKCPLYLWNAEKQPEAGKLLNNYLTVINI